VSPGQGVCDDIAIEVSTDRHDLIQEVRISSGEVVTSRDREDAGEDVAPDEVTTACSGRRLAGEFVWPLWDVPAGPEVVRFLVARSRFRT
jgi:hypothetical protein